MIYGHQLGYAAGGPDRIVGGPDRIVGGPDRMAGDRLCLSLDKKKILPVPKSKVNSEYYMTFIRNRPVLYLIKFNKVTLYLILTYNNPLKIIAYVTSHLILTSTYYLQTLKFKK
jgi:hypothetical protein